MADPGLWMRAGLWLLAMLTVVAIVLIIVAHFPQEALGLFGAELLFYRLLIRSRWRPFVQGMTSVCSGASLALLAPLLAWPSVAYRFPLLAIIGGMPAAMSYNCSALVATACIGTSVGSLLWQLGLCTLVPRGHSCLLACCGIGFAAVFRLPRLGMLVEWVVFPVLGALLFVISIGPLLGMLGQEALLEESQCEAGDRSPAVLTAIAWSVLGMCAMIFQTFMLRSNSTENGGEQDQLAEFLLPSAGGPVLNKNLGDGEGGPKKAIPEKDAGVQRLPILCQAIYAEEGTDQSHLTEHEKKLVEICRKDEFERDRVLFGGGLI